MTMTAIGCHRVLVEVDGIEPTTSALHLQGSAS
jgi:hypothetical protein